MAILIRYPSQEMNYLFSYKRQPSFISIHLSHKVLPSLLSSEKKCFIPLCVLAETLDLLFYIPVLDYLGLAD